MTVSFNADDIAGWLDQEMSKPLIKKQPAKQQSDSLYLFLSYVTFSEKKPIVWEPYSTRGDKDGFSAYVDVVESLQKENVTGYKVVCFYMNALDENYVPQRIEKYCAEKWEPKIKTYVNGPKKSFPKKAPGHF